MMAGFFGKSSKLKTDDYPLVHDIEGNNTSGLNLEKKSKVLNSKNCFND